MNNFIDGSHFFKYLDQYGIKPFSVYGGTVYLYATLENAAAIIDGGCLKYGTADRFNDPFELSNDLLDTRATREQIRSFVNRNLDHKPRRDRQSLIKDLCKNPGKLGKAYAESVEHMKKQIGICCFSALFDHPLMWSHYADKHKGVCLGFHLNPFDDRDRIILHCKVYKSGRTHQLLLRTVCSNFLLAFD